MKIQRKIGLGYICGLDDGWRKGVYWRLSRCLEEGGLLETSRCLEYNIVNPIMKVTFGL